MKALVKLPMKPITAAEPMRHGRLGGKGERLLSVIWSVVNEK